MLANHYDVVPPNKPAAVLQACRPVHACMYPAISPSHPDITYEVCVIWKAMFMLNKQAMDIMKTYV